MFGVGDIIKRLPNREPSDPPYDIFKNDNDIFVVIDIIVQKGRRIYCIKSLNGPDVFYSGLYNRNKLWIKLS